MGVRPGHAECFKAILKGLQVFGIQLSLKIFDRWQAEHQVHGAQHLTKVELTIMVSGTSRRELSLPRIPANCPSASAGGLRCMIVFRSDSHG